MTGGHGHAPKAHKGPYGPFKDMLFGLHVDPKAPQTPAVNRRLAILTGTWIGSLLLFGMYFDRVRSNWVEDRLPGGKERRLKRIEEGKHIQASRHSHGGAY